MRATWNKTSFERRCNAENGQVERYNKTITNSLATMGANKNDKTWDETLINLHVGLNGTLNQAIGVSPSEALMGYPVICRNQLQTSSEDVVDVT